MHLDLHKMQQEPPKTFRFKFTPEFADSIHVFAKLHRFDSLPEFKEAWTKWTTDLSDVIESETKYLQDNGFTGSVNDKMWIATRHYYRKKKTEKTEPKKRRRYVSVDTEVITLMDDHITDWCRRKDFKPATAFSHFCENNRNHLETEVLRLYSEENLPEEDIPTKLKKTYKNRYFQRVKAPLLATTLA